MSAREPLRLETPWLAPYRAPLSAHPDVASLLACDGSRVRFVPSNRLPTGARYETHIAETAQVPTRDNLHDFFNAIVWLALPRAKWRLNAMQSRAIAHAGVGGTRGPLRDALTLLDENGALLSAPAPVWEALTARAWRRLFVELRPLWAEARLVIVGHALLEQLETPRKALTAHVLAEPMPWPAGAATQMNPSLDLLAADVWLDAQLTRAEWLATKPFTPLPVLGVPGFWPENQNFCFYDDSTVFRPRRASHNEAQQGISATGAA